MVNSKVSSAEHEKPNKHLPERNVKNEATIVSQAVGMLLFGAVMVGLLANPFLVIPLFFVPPLFVAYLSFIALLFVEGVVVLKQYRRVDRYRQRITALSVILLLPVFAVIFNTLAVAATLLHTILFISRNCLHRLGYFWGCLLWLLLACYICGDCYDFRIGYIGSLSQHLRCQKHSINSKSMACGCSELVLAFLASH